jgi:hypothetical protein
MLEDLVTLAAFVAFVAGLVLAGYFGTRHARPEMRDAR